MSRELCFTFNHEINRIQTFADDSLSVTPILLIVVGAIVFVIAFFGCCGAIKKSPCMILTFFVLLIIVFAMEIGIGVGAYLKYGHLEQVLEKGFQNTLETYETSLDSRHAWDLIQGELNCCGVNGPSDWMRVYQNGSLPRDCCTVMPLDMKECTVMYAQPNGCLPELLQLLQTKPLVIGGIAVGVALLQLLAMCFSCCLSRSFCHKYDSV